ncbi:hypothetical protein [Sulfitobacter sp. EhC04]|uniref:hypothetical protein n=1 Tax=Sulfitobacter sp. EhC04 TaxID=1849168 RepID=UPI001912F2ED|nr:hypothetical protein [Sulfitobacter sp. EhC04]
MSSKPYRKGKRGAGRHVQLPEYLQASEAWATLKPGPRALYIELKRRYMGSNNGRIILSHRQAAEALNVHRNTVGAWFAELEERGFIFATQRAYLGPSGIGQAALWALQEMPAIGEASPRMGFRTWRPKMQKPRTKSLHRRHSECDTPGETTESAAGNVTKLVPRG